MLSSQSPPWSLIRSLPRGGGAGGLLAAGAAWLAREDGLGGASTVVGGGVWVGRKATTAIPRRSTAPAAPRAHRRDGWRAGWMGAVLALERLLSVGSEEAEEATGEGTAITESRGRSSGKGVPVTWW